MARIGKTYPRFKPSEPPSPPAPERAGVSRFQVFGALVGVVAALGLIGFLLTR